MRYKECEYCGATLDAGEKCDCVGSQAITPEKRMHLSEIHPLRRKHESTQLWYHKMPMPSSP